MYDYDSQFLNLNFFVIAHIQQLIQLTRNQLTSVPEEIGQLTALTEVDV